MASTDRRVVVAVDLDEVLGQFVNALATWHNAKFGTQHNVADYFSYHFADVWKCSTDEATERVYEFFASDNFNNIEPLDGAADALRSLRDTHRFVVVTSRQAVLEAQTRQWLSKHFADVFEDVKMANHYAKDGASKTKLELCAEVGASVLVDDSLKYVSECGGKLPTVVLFGDYAWNTRPSGAPLGPGVVRAHNWVQLKGILSRLGRTGTLSPQDAVVCTLKHKAEFYCNSVRWVLENQKAVHVTALGAAVATLVRAVDMLQRAGDVETLSLRTGVDAAAPNRDRQPRMTVHVGRTEALVAKLVKIANETPRYRAARSALEASRTSADKVDLSPTAPIIGTGDDHVRGVAAQVTPANSQLASALVGGAAAAAQSATAPA